MQKHGHPAVPHRANGRGPLTSSSEFPGRLPYPVHQLPTRDSPFSVAPPGRESPPRNPVPENFTVPGEETASVLQISKRPRLRQKDIAHRQSLLLKRDDTALLSTLEGQRSMTPALPIPPANPVFIPPRLGDYSPAHQPVDNFMALLRFGQRKVGVATSLRMSVHELQETAAQIAGLSSGDIALMIGDTHLPLYGVLGDYVFPNETRGTVISVVSSVGLRPQLRLHPSHVLQFFLIVHAHLDLISASSLTDGENPAVYLINIVHEDGSVAQQPVTSTMLVRQIRGQVAMSYDVAPDSVSLMFQGEFWNWIAVFWIPHLSYATPMCMHTLGSVHSPPTIITLA